MFRWIRKLKQSILAKITLTNTNTKREGVALSFLHLIHTEGESNQWLLSPSSHWGRLGEGKKKNTRVGVLFLALGWDYSAKSTTSRGSRMTHWPRVKSGMATGAPPLAIDSCERHVMTIHAAAS